MKMNSKCFVNILIIFATIITTALCKTENGTGVSSKVKKTYTSGVNAVKSALGGLGGNHVNGLKKKIKSGYNSVYSPENRQKLRTNKLGRTITKGIGFAPPLKEDDIDELVSLVKNDADLIKMSAFKKLQLMYKKSTNSDQKIKLVLALLLSAKELIKYNSVILNIPRMNLMFYEGIQYAKACDQLLKSDNGECLKLKTLLIEAYILNDVILFNGLTINMLKTSLNAAKKKLPDDEELKFMEKKLKCEVKLAGQNRNVLIKKVVELYQGHSVQDQQYDCVKDILEYQDKIKETGLTAGEYYFLLGRAFAKSGNRPTAIKCLNFARNHPVKYEKDRYVNKQVQELIEKLYLREHS